MRERLRRLAAVVRADYLIRLRRPSTVVVFLLLSAMPYMWIPEPSSGRAIMVIKGQRAVYNSAAIGLSTAMLGTICIGLFGFYVVSNALKRDVLSRCGFVIASTTMRGSEYIAGKFAGNVVFLSAFMLGFMTVSMVMLLVRGEAPLEPLVFMRQYLVLVPPSIMFVSAVAIVFECTPLLRTKFGDVLYFFLWMTSLGIVALLMEQGIGRSWAPYFDISGLGLMLQQIRAYYGTSSMTIGATPFNAANGTMLFTGVRFGPEWIAPRIVASIWPIALLGVARLFFHRFDPARLRATTERAKTSWLGRLNALARPLSRPFMKLVPVTGPPTLLRSAFTDALTTIASFPLAVVAAAGLAIAAFASPSPHVSILPIAFAACAIVIADISSREKRAATIPLVFAAPGLRTRFVWWKFASTLLVALTILIVPLLRAIAVRPSSSLALLVGVLFTCAAATALGIVSSSPKTFIVVFLTFWYVATQDKGASPSLDFAGWFGTATPAVIASYAAATLVLLATAHAFHRRELARQW